jgi:hypothetical protein
VLKLESIPVSLILVTDSGQKRLFFSLSALKPRKPDVSCARFSGSAEALFYFTCRPCPQLFILLDIVFVVGLPILSLNESREVDVLVSSYMTGRRLFSSEECLVFILLTT